MNAVQTRPRRWSSRLNNQSQNQNPVIGDRYETMLYPNQNYERIIYETPGVNFRPLPFYDQICEIIRPAGLISDEVVGRLNESQVKFTLTVDQADMVAMSLNTKQILVRFCYLDTSCEQDDNFPPDVQLLVNGQIIVLPPAISNPNKPNLPAKRPGQHVDITKQCKLCPYIPNEVDIKWFVDPIEPKRSYALTIIIADRLNSNTLLKRIQSRGLSDPQETKKLIVDSDLEVATTNLQSSLLCPLGKIRMSLPCKSIKCHHIPCFDALVYLQMNEKKASWICPICYKPAYFSDLMIDGFFMSILDQAEANVTEVTLNSDGSWGPVLKMEQPTSAKKPLVEVITISDDDD